MPSQITKSSITKSHITVMTSTNQELEQGEIFDRNDFTNEGQRIKVGVIKIIEVQQDSYDQETKIWSKSMVETPTFDPKTGKTKTEMKPKVGYLVIMYEKDDPEHNVRTLRINSKAGVKWMKKYLLARAEKISKYIPDEELVLEKVDNGPGKYASVLPLGA